MDTKVDISLTHPSSNMDDRKVATLRVVDRVSGMLLVQVDLTPDEFMDLHRSATVWASNSAEVSDYLDRVGKRMVVETLKWQRGEFTVVGYDYKAVPPEIQESIDFHVTSLWDTADARQTNFGWQVVFRKWIDDPDYDVDAN